VGLALGTLALARPSVAALRRGSGFDVALAAGIVGFAVHQVLDSALMTTTGAVMLGLLSVLVFRLRPNQSAAGVSAARASEMEGRGNR
jgi:hypothetical protein